MSGETSGQILHCERPVRVKSTRFGWDNEIEVETKTMTCVECSADIVLTVRRWVGVPAS